MSTIEFDVRKQKHVIFKADGCFYEYVVTSFDEYTIDEGEHIKTDDFQIPVESDEYDSDSDIEKESVKEAKDPFVNQKWYTEEPAIYEKIKKPNEAECKKIKTNALYEISAKIFWDQRFVSELIDDIKESHVINLGHFKNKISGEISYSDGKESLQSLMLKSFIGMENISDVHNLSANSECLYGYKAVYELLHPELDPKLKDKNQSDPNEMDVLKTPIIAHSIFSMPEITDKIRQYIQNSSLFA